MVSPVPGRYSPTGFATTRLSPQPESKCCLRERRRSDAGGESTSADLAKTIVFFFRQAIIRYHRALLSNTTRNIQLLREETAHVGRLQCDVSATALAISWHLSILASACIRHDSEYYTIIHSLPS